MNDSNPTPADLFSLVVDSDSLRPWNARLPPRPRDGVCRHSRSRSRSTDLDMGPLTSLLNCSWYPDGRHTLRIWQKMEMERGRIRGTVCSSRTGFWDGDGDGVGYAQGLQYTGNHFDVGDERTYLRRTYLTGEPVFGQSGSGRFFSKFPLSSDRFPCPEEGWDGYSMVLTFADRSVPGSGGLPSLVPLWSLTPYPDNTRTGRSLPTGPLLQERPRWPCSEWT